ncbi:translation initiation factor IF-2 [Rhodamnia argentea]|uniref:Translation initiation factor IF-2 n=1 Tax=Rhodamnia argentea TaxID=178133 RepID=A0A8B8P1Y7_9MYRT|nr:translation initiation factor IF-2 [Rhodamnia argentea]
MGCCASTHGRRPSASSSSDHRRAKSTESRAPPPSMDEETVKEVLSETPTCPNAKPAAREAGYPLLARREKSPAVFAAADEASEEVSEICSLSESLSTATNLTDDAKPRAGNRPPAKLRGQAAAKSRSLPRDVGVRNDHGNRSRASGNSPAKRLDRSPARVNSGGSLRMVQSREPGSFRAVSARGGRPDPGERSGRRSGSPATSRVVGSAGPAVGRTPSARRTNPSPGRVRPGPTEGRNHEARGGGGGKRTSSAKESLENPLVSLECFIFL